MGTSERRSEIVRVLCRRRHETIANLALEFGVSERTIQRDIDALSMSVPIYTQSGRYGGGVYIQDTYSMDRMYMTDREVNVLKKLVNAVDIHPGMLTGEERSTLSSIIALYEKPRQMIGKEMRQT